MIYYEGGGGWLLVGYIGALVFVDLLAFLVIYEYTHRRISYFDKVILCFFAFLLWFWFSIRG